MTDNGPGFSVAISTLAIFAMTSRREDGGEGWSCGGQHISWNCITVIDCGPMFPWNVNHGKKSIFMTNIYFAFASWTLGLKSFY